MTESALGGGNPREGRREQGPPSSDRLLPASPALSPFRSSQPAVRFALAYARPPSSSPVWLTGMSSHDALSGEDALAQAGMIVAALKTLGHPTLSILVARVLPHSVPCGCDRPCCMGRRPNFEWQRALESVTRRAFDELDIRLHPAIARAIASRSYARGPNDLKLSESFMVDVAIVSDSARAFRRWLMGGRSSPGAEPEAWRKADERLRELRVVVDE